MWRKEIDDVPERHAMRDHGALGVPGGAGGVHDRPQVIMRQFRGLRDRRGVANRVFER